ncbi:MAG: putative sporulation protein YtxC [Clostridia bacterium]|jgi:putative sporulation protein YtxC|nr:putative sporulation protein YtxC [Clostridia bacterium]
MKSFCIKTNNNAILEYLLDKLDYLELEEVKYSKNKFKIYSNIIVHYIGEKISFFDEKLSSIITDTILKFYKEKMIKKIINFDYFYFEEYEKKIIIQNCCEIIESSEYEQISKEKEYIHEAVLQYVIESKSMILEGFVNFRIKEYIKYLDSIVDIAVNKYIIEKEYNEFISLLRMYINSKKSNIKNLHLIYGKSELTILDENKNIVPLCKEIYNAKFLSDIIFSENDYALNTLLTLLPQRIEIHLLDSEDEFIKTVKLIFEDRVYICRECNICRTYKMIKMTKQQ